MQEGKYYEYQMKMTWALEPATVHIIEGKIYGITIMGGHLLEVGADEYIHMLKRNFEAPFTCSLYSHSIVFDDKIYYMPLNSKAIMVYDYKAYSAREIALPEELSGGMLSPFVYDDSLYFIYTDVGRVYRYSEKKRFELVSDLWRGKHVLLPKRDLVSGSKRVFQRVYENRQELWIYDCEQNKWLTVMIPEGILREFIWDDKYIWYATDKGIYRIVINGGADKKPQELFRFEAEQNFISIVESEKKDVLYIFRKNVDGYMELNKETCEWKVTRAAYMERDENIRAYRMDKDNLLLRQFEGWDWMVRQGEKYGILNMANGQYKEIPIFQLDDNCRDILNETYINRVWAVYSDGILPENKYEGLEFLLATLQSELASKGNISVK